MNKRLIIFTAGVMAAAAVLALAPRAVDVTSAHDCWAWQTTGNCSARNVPQYIDSYVVKDHQDPTWYPSPASLTQASQFTQAGNCMFNVSLSWSVPGSNTTTVTVQNPDNGQEQAFASGSGSGSAAVPWIQPGKNYRFTLWDQNYNQVAQTWISGTGLNCNMQTTSAPTQTYFPQYPTSASPSNYYSQSGTPTYFGNAPTYSSGQPYSTSPYTNTSPQVNRRVNNAWPDDPFANEDTNYYNRICPNFNPC